MTLQPGQQRITIQILVNISRIKGNQTIKFGQLIEHPKRNIFLWKLYRKLGKETCSRPLFVFLKSFILGKSQCSAAWFHYILIALKLAYYRNKLFKTLHIDPEICSILIFLVKGLGIVSPANFGYDFSTKIFLMLQSINWPNFIAWLPLLLDILSNTFIAIVC